MMINGLQCDKEALTIQESKGWRQFSDVEKSKISLTQIS